MVEKLENRIDELYSIINQLPYEKLQDIHRYIVELIAKEEDKKISLMSAKTNSDIWDNKEDEIYDKFME